MASELSKLVLIFAFFTYTGHFIECLIALSVLLFLRSSAGGFHCEHYITCFLLSFLFIYVTIFLSETVHPNPFLIFIGMLFNLLVAYFMVPVVSHHRPVPNEQLIKNSRKANFAFLFICLLATTAFHTSHYTGVIFWMCLLHSIQLLVTKLDKGGKYHVTQSH